MKRSDLLKRIPADSAHLNEWIRAGIVKPSTPPEGSGRHCQYDDVSLVAATIALEMQGLAITVAHYGESFAALHALLRARPWLEWCDSLLEITPTAVQLVPDRSQFSGRAVLTIDLSQICLAVLITPSQQQLNFGLKGA